VDSFKLGKNYLWVKGIQVCSTLKGWVLFKGEIITKNVKMGCGHLKIFLRTMKPEKQKFT
jgi:hypothetical protein